MAQEFVRQNVNLPTMQWAHDHLALTGSAAAREDKWGELRRLTPILIPVDWIFYVSNMLALT